MGPDGPADPPRGIDLPGSSRRRIQPVRARPRRHRPRPGPVRAARRAGEGLAADRREPIGAHPAPVGDRVRRVGAGYLAWRQRRPDRDLGRAGDGSAPRPQLVEHGVRRPDRLPRPRRTTDIVDGRSDRVPGPQRRPGSTFRPGPRSPAPGSRGRGHGSVHRPADQHRARRRSTDPGPGPARRGGRRHEPGRTHPTRANGRPRGRPARCGRVLGRGPGHGPGPDARPLDGHHAQPVAPLPDAGVPALGEDRVLPGRGRVRVPRPAPGRHRPADPEARARPGTPPEGGGAPVRGGGRPALVASAIGSGRPHPDLRRSPLAAVHGGALPRGHGRLDGPRRDRPLSRRTPAPTGRGRRLLPAGTLNGVGFAVRSLRGGDRREPRGRRPWAATHRVGRLERRDEPGGSRGPGRECLAGLVPAHRPGRVRPHRRGPRRACSRGALASPHEVAPASPRTRWLGWRLVPPSLLRRRHSARLGGERRMSDRLDRPVVERPVRAPRTRLGRSGRWLPWRNTSSDAATVSSSCSPRRSTIRTSTRVTSRAMSPASGRTAASTPTAPSGRSSPSRRWATATRRANCSRSSTRSTTPAPGPGSSATRWSRT